MVVPNANPTTATAATAINTTSDSGRSHDSSMARVASYPQRRRISPRRPLFLMDSTRPPTNGAAIDPSFMFCMTCHNNDKEMKELEEADEVKLDEGEGNNLHVNGVLLHTNVRLRDPVANPSRQKTFQLPLETVPGVHTEEQDFVVKYDSSSSTENASSALKNMTAHPAMIVAEAGMRGPTSAEPLWVRSQLLVQGICCASEVPAVRRIVKPLTGVANLQINILNKTVHVQHDATLITALEIAQKLTEDGFPSKVKQDGNVSVLAKQQASHHGRTVLQVRGSLSDVDVPRAQGLLSPLMGISRITFSISDGLIHIDHDQCAVTSEQCQHALSPYFECQILSTTDQPVGSAETSAFDSVRRSRFVESTIQMERLSTEHIGRVKMLLRKFFEEAHVRAVYPNPSSRTIKVEHDPELASILEICGVLTSHGLMNVYVAVDGAEAGLYLPESSPCSGLIKTEDEPSFLRIHANVWVSGIFWILSLISYDEGR